MNKHTFRHAAAAAMLISVPALAQPAPPAPPGYPPAPPGDFGPGHGPGARLRELHDRLGITPAQQPQWDAVVAAMRENGQAMRASPAVQALRSGHLNAPQTIRASADLARQRADDLARLAPAVDALYASLSPQQRQVADQEMQRLVHRGEHRPG